MTRFGQANLEFSPCVPRFSKSIFLSELLQVFKMCRFKLNFCNYLMVKSPTTHHRPEKMKQYIMNMN